MPEFDDIDDILMLSQQDSAEIAALELEKQPLIDVDSTNEIFTWRGDYEWSGSMQSAQEIEGQRNLLQGVIHKGTIRLERSDLRILSTGILRSG
jgi:hypothetical protein